MTAAKQSPVAKSTATEVTEAGINALLGALGKRPVHSDVGTPGPRSVGSPKALILNGDALHVLRQIKRDSFVDAVVTSPPYWKLRPAIVGGEIGQEPTIEEYLSDLAAVFDEINRILKKSGSLWINLGDRIINEEEQQIPNRFALFMRGHGWILHKTIIWSKPNYNPAGRRRNLPVTFEHIFWFVKSHDFYWNLIKEERRTDPVAEAIHRERKRDTKFSGQSKIGPGWNGKFHYGNKSGQEYLRSIQDGRAMIDVWTIPSACHGGSEHTEPFPVEIPRRALMATCPPCGISMDPFSGLGTTGIAALEQGKSYIGIEINPAYANLSVRSLGLELSTKT